MRNLLPKLPGLTLALAICGVVLFAAGCGGGGGGSNLNGSGGSGGGGGGGGGGGAAGNVATITVDSGPAGINAGIFNTPYVSVTICAPGTSTCQTIDHVTVDTGSSGFRVIGSVLNATMSAALHTINDAQGQPYFECTAFADGYIWGPVASADLKIASETASSVPIQVIGGTTLAVPSDCSSGAGQEENTVDQFGANGILGIAVFQQDCGPACASGNPAGTPISGTYYVCPNSGCVSSLIPLAQQVPNPAFSFATDNNGTIIQLPSVANFGAATLTGSLIFGIDTQSNNTLGMATVLTVDPNTGNFTATINAQTLSQSFIDSGSNAFFFPDAGTTVCSSQVASGFYCPTSIQSLQATIQSFTGVMATVPFTVQSADTLFNTNPTFTAFNNVAAPNLDALSGSFDFGLPFFIGRSVFTAHENRTTSAGAGPFVAF